MKCGFCWKSSKDDNMNDECGAGSPSPTTTHTQCLPQQLGNISTVLYNEPVFTWRAHTTLPDTVGAFQGAVASYQPCSTHRCQRCKGNLDVLSLQLASPWLCTHKWVVWSTSEANSPGHPSYFASWLCSWGGSAGPKLDFFQRREVQLWGCTKFPPVFQQRLKDLKQVVGWTE